MKAEELYLNLRKDAGVYPSWTPKVSKDVFRMIDEENALDILKEVNPDIGIKDLLDKAPMGENIKYMYGFTHDPQYDPVNSLFSEVMKLFDMSLPGHERLENSIFRIFPRLMRLDDLTGAYYSSKEINGLVIKADDGSYVAGISTAFFKFIEDFAVITRSVYDDGMGGAIYKIPVAKLAYSLVTLVESRWINEQNPPTWDMNYMPGDLYADNQWLMGKAISQAMITSFFLSHEAAHIVHDHFEQGKTTSYFNDQVKVPIRSKENEFEADAKALNLLKPCLESPQYLPYMLEGLGHILLFFSFMERVEQIGGIDLAYHPSVSERRERLQKQIVNDFGYLFNLDLYNLIMDPHERLFDLTYEFLKERLND